MEASATAGGTLTLPIGDDVLLGRDSIDTITGVKTFGVANNTAKLQIAGSVSGISILEASATAGGTLTLPIGDDVLVGRDSVDTLTNKTFDANATGNSIFNLEIEDLADKVTGELISWDLNNSPVAVPAGTTGQKLVALTGSAPEFKTGARAFVALNDSATITNNVVVSALVNGSATITTTGSWDNLENSNFVFITGSGEKTGEVQFIGSTDISAELNWSTSLNVSGNNVPFFISVFKDDVEVTNTRINEQRGTTTDFFNMGGNAIIPLSNGEKVRLGVGGETTPVTINISKSQYIITEL